MKHEVPDLIPVLSELARRAWKSIRTVAGKIYELVRPPADLRVSSTEGYEYSGVIVIDNNEVEGGAVARTGFDGSSPGRSHGNGPLITPPSSYGESERSPYLRSWAEDPRQEEDEKSWQRYR